MVNILAGGGWGGVGGMGRGAKKNEITLYMYKKSTSQPLHRGSTVELRFRQRFRVGLLLSTRIVSSQSSLTLLIYMFAVLIH